MIVSESRCPAQIKSGPGCSGSCSGLCSMRSAAMVRYDLVAISGSTRRPSRSRALAEAIAGAIPLPINLMVYDLVDAGRGLGGAYTREELPATARDILHAIEAAD